MSPRSVFAGCICMLLILGCGDPIATDLRQFLDRPYARFSASRDRALAINDSLTKKYTSHQIKEDAYVDQMRNECVPLLKTVASPLSDYKAGTDEVRSLQKKLIDWSGRFATLIEDEVDTHGRKDTKAVLEAPARLAGLLDENARIVLDLRTLAEKHGVEWK